MKPLEKKARKIRYRQMLLIVLALISVCFVAVIIAKSTDHVIDTIYVASDGAKTFKTTDVKLLLSGSDNEPLSGVIVRVDESEQTYTSDATGYVILENITYGNHVLHITAKDGKTYEYPIRMTIDFDLNTCCVVEWGDMPHIKTPNQVKQLMLQFVLEDGSLFLTNETAIIKETGSLFLSDQTEILPDGRMYFPDGCRIENGFFYLSDGTAYRIGEDLYFTETGIVVFPDGTVLPESRNFYVVGNDVRILGDRPADLHNGYYKEQGGAVVDEEGNRIYPDGSVEMNDHTVVPPGTHTKTDAVEEAEKYRENHEKTDSVKETEETEESTEPETKPAPEKQPNESEQNKEPEQSAPQIDPATVEEYSGETWIQASKLHVFSDSDNLSGGAFKDADGTLVIAPGAKGSYHFRIGTKNQRVSFILKLYHDGELSIPMKMQLEYPDGSTSEWFSLEDAVSVETAHPFEENVTPSNSFSNYTIHWWWDDTVDDSYDTEIGIKAASEIVNYYVYAVLQVTTE